ncbi:MAG: hypothetical protein NC453_08835 [Muribaculum sp.]|nr:hypothetical protein [Muribaculum sp.]
MLSNALIFNSKKFIDRLLVVLQKEISQYERRENTIAVNLGRIREIYQNPFINPTERMNSELLTTLKDANESLRIMNQRSLREMDNISANLTGHLSVLIDECIENYDISLKVWIKSRIQQLADMRELTVNGSKMYISFPVAVAQLSPYLLKTRMPGEPLASKLLPIRKAIRTLAEMS